MDGVMGNAADARGHCSRVWQRARGTRLGSKETTANGFQVPKGDIIEAWTQTFAQVGVPDCLSRPS